jgi:hypothetical protein
MKAKDSYHNNIKFMSEIDSIDTSKKLDKIKKVDNPLLNQIDRN